LCLSVPGPRFAITFARTFNFQETPMYRRILVPVDGSSLSEYAIPFAVETARRAGGSVLLLRAMPESLIVTDIPVSIQATARKLAQRELDRQAKAWAVEGVKIETDLQIAFPLEAILTNAAKCDLVVMTTHGEGGLRRLILGSVADKVMRLCSRPVLAIHPPAKCTAASAQAAALRMFRDAVVALDGSTTAAKALKELKQFADGGTLIHLVRVVGKTASESIRQLAEEGLKDAASPLEVRGMPVACAVVKNDSPADALVDYAMKKRCGLIVMTTRGASGLERWMLGGITDKVVRHGPTPVLVIRSSRPLWKKGQRPLGVRKSITV
jgi:nucleotide-binding universal stress UspA family protein